MINIASFISETITNIAQTTEVGIQASNWLEGLVPSLPVLIASLVSLLILVVVISYFAYFPVKKFLAERKEYVSNNIEESEKMNTQAKETLEKAQTKVVNSKKEGKDIIQKYTEKANKEADVIVEKAKEKSNKIVEQANVRVVEAEKKMRADLNEEISSIAIQATEKLLKENINNNTNKKLVDEFINELNK